MRILIFDPKIAGVSGDMLLSSLIDLTNSLDEVLELEEVINRLDSCRKFKVNVVERDAGIRAKGLEIEIEERKLANPSEFKRAVEFVVNHMDLPERGAKWSGM
ncbi:MAG: pyridinium-3,5-bisthiocarboxylic acid mononucleotide nickel chelatase [Archaeoglobus sp.]|jgi:hypothetical protein|uniref:DUF111 family protein n=1 Tax=Archaeoglobus fulgidus TaxID=2234 RepID=A0A117KLT3_ARCFL|nr:nickel insertion protein [Archaeoglobus sp.]KUJ93041.1 MAG: hypothetical protein XD40_1768 [Archaeoglobus fulgidus]KUK06585.1 MAG: Uncharacterized protein XD48_1185 [Archaeoglobus fulgidus]MDI3497481.1 pyridinium-3,5-bisthiocarboxylic acid mononucleotide nickel chelatase [Archaeoglobus sp.]